MENLRETSEKPHVIMSIKYFGCNGIDADRQKESECGLTQMGDSGVLGVCGLQTR